MESDLHKQVLQNQKPIQPLGDCLRTRPTITPCWDDFIRFHINKFVSMEKSVEKPDKWSDAAEPPQISPDDKVRFKSPVITRFLSESRPLFSSVVQKVFRSKHGPYTFKRLIFLLVAIIEPDNRIPP
jgi:hypothetical protein